MSRVALWTHDPPAPQWASWGRPPRLPGANARRNGYPGGAHLEVSASVSAGLGALAAELAAERRWREQLAAAIAPVEVPAIGAFTAGPYLQAAWGPKDGYCWAVQRLTVATLGAADLLQVYRGASVADVNGSQNLLNGWQGSAGTVQTWNPGRTGCMLAARQTLIFTGTLSGGPYMVNADVIQLESWLLPYFLL